MHRRITSKACCGELSVSGFASRLEGKWKMSQNRELEDRDGVVKGLRSRNDGDDLRVADAVSAASDLG
jgi:predicted FMN-binding regulatory protein PaiB